MVITPVAFSSLEKCFYIKNEMAILLSRLRRLCLTATVPVVLIKVNHGTDVLLVLAATF